jgi:hypothetical protein
MLVFAIACGLWVWTPFLAPLFAHLGREGPSNAIYFVYSFFCHQLPGRSYFLFGPKVSHSLADIQAVWINTVNPMLLGKFTGTAVMGWKVAWSDCCGGRCSAGKRPYRGVFQLAGGPGFRHRSSE